MTFNQIVAEVKFNRTYTCHLCGFKEVGTSETAILYVNSPAELAEALDNQKQSSHSMPYGWGYYGHFRCQTCIKDS